VLPGVEGKNGDHLVRVGANEEGVAGTNGENFQLTVVGNDPDPTLTKETGDVVREESFEVLDAVKLQLDLLQETRTDYPSCGHVGESVEVEFVCIRLACEMVLQCSVSMRTKLT
jgi:hypothetical protein